MIEISNGNAQVGGLLLLEFVSGVAVSLVSTKTSGPCGCGFVACATCRQGVFASGPFSNEAAAFGHSPAVEVSIKLLTVIWAGLAILFFRKVLLNFLRQTCSSVGVLFHAVSKAVVSLSLLAIFFAFCSWLNFSKSV